MPPILVHRYKRSLILRNEQRATTGILLRQRDRGRRKRPLAHGSRSPATERKGLQNPQKQRIPRCTGMCLSLIDKCKRLNQYSHCGQDGHYWVKCPSVAPVVASSHIRRKQSAGEAGHKATTVPKSRRIEAAPKPAVKQVVAVLHESPPPDLDILEVDTDIDD